MSDHPRQTPETLRLASESGGGRWSDPSTPAGPTPREVVDTPLSTEPGHVRFDAGPLVLALEDIWAGLSEHEPDLPRAVIILASGGGRKWGHWAVSRWRVEDRTTVGEVLIAGELLRRGASAVLATLLHEAAHALAHAGRIKDTCRQGRYHNANFKRLAEHLGLLVEQGRPHGWTRTSLSPDTVDRYADELRRLAVVIQGYRRGDPHLPRPDSKVRSGHECGCAPPRRLGIPKSILERGAILCGVCMRPFRKVEPPGGSSR